MIGEIATAVAGLGGLTVAGVLMQRWMDRVETSMSDHDKKLDSLGSEMRAQLSAHTRVLNEHLAQELVFVERLESMEARLPNGQLEKILAKLEILSSSKPAARVRKKRR